MSEYSNRQPVGYSKVSAVFESASGLVYMVYYYGDAEFYQVWCTTTWVQYACYTQNQFFAFRKSWEQILGVLTKVWEEGLLYRLQVQGWAVAGGSSALHQVAKAAIAAKCAQQQVIAPVTRKAAKVAAASGKPVKANRRQLDLSFN